MGKIVDSDITIGLDLDGVYYNWGDTVRYMIKSNHGIDLPRSTHWHYVQENVPEHVWKWLWASGNEKGMFRHGSIIKGAVEGVEALAKDYSVEVVTHRPAWAIPDTCLFIATRMPPVLKGVHFFTKEEPKSIIGADIYLDDRPDVIHEVLAAGRQAVVFDQPWNQNLETKSPHWRAFCWENVPEVIADAADFVRDRRKERELVHA